MIYLVTFLISTILLYLYENKKIKGKFIVVIALLLPCLLAGARDLSVGTDTDWYPKLLFDAANSSDGFKNYFNTIVYQNTGWGLLYKVSSFEIGFSFLTYIIAKITNNFQILLFVIQLIIILPIYFGVKKYKYINENKLIWLSMLTYYLFNYNWGINAIRQCMAISIIFWGISSFINGDKSKWLKYFMSLLIAISFHNTAIISIVIIFIYYFVKEEKNFFSSNIIISDTKKINLSSIIIVFAFLACIIMISVPNLLRNIILILNVDRKYLNYIGTNFEIVGSSIFLIPIILIFLMYRKKFKQIYNHNFYTIMYILYMFSIQLSTASSQFGSRISFFFMVFNTIGIPTLASSPSIKSNKKINYFIVISTALLYWIYNFMIRNYGNTYPYIFFSQGGF